MKRHNIKYEHWLNIANLLLTKRYSRKYTVSVLKDIAPRFEPKKAYDSGWTPGTAVEGWMASMEIDVDKLHQDGEWLVHEMVEVDYNRQQILYTSGIWYYVQEPTIDISSIINLDAEDIDFE